MRKGSRSTAARPRTRLLQQRPARRLLLRPHAHTLACVAAYVSIRQHTSAYVTCSNILRAGSCFVLMRACCGGGLRRAARLLRVISNTGAANDAARHYYCHQAAYVSIRQHTSACHRMSAYLMRVIIPVIRLRLRAAAAAAAAAA
jgi:hypothetical protein